MGWNNSDRTSDPMKITIVTDIMEFPFGSLSIENGFQKMSFFRLFLVLSGLYSSLLVGTFTCFSFCT